MKLNSTFLISALAGIDLASADGRAGIASLLSEIERRDPGAILRSAARVQGRQLRERTAFSRADTSRDAR